MTTHLRISLALALTLCAFPVSATAEPYWITYEGNDLPENEGWERHWGNDEGAHEGDGAIRTVEDGILTMDSLYDLRVYDYACHYLYGELDPDPGELFVAEWRGLVDEVLGDHYDAKVGISSDDDWQLGIACFPDHILSKFEDVEIPIEPGMFHEYRVLSWDMQTYDLYIDDDLAHQGTFWHGSLASKFHWGDCVSGAANLSHWDYVRFGVVPEPSVVWLFAAGLAAYAARAVPRRIHRVVLLPVLACLLVASASAEPYWIAYEGNDFPENEGWDRVYGDEYGPWHGGAERSIEDGVLVLDGRRHHSIFDYYGIRREVDPSPGETFIMQWRVRVSDMPDDEYDPGVSVSSDEDRMAAFSYTNDSVFSYFEDGVSAPLSAGEFHEFEFVSNDMLTYELYIDGVPSLAGDFWDPAVSFGLVNWGDGVQGVASLSEWDYFRFGVVPEATSLSLAVVTMMSCCRRRRR
jgi:hypothetical protein